MGDCDYNEAWRQWGDMIQYSPAPFHRRRLIIELLKRCTPVSVLDVGCGNGVLIKQVQEVLGPARLVGVDKSEDVIGSNRQTFEFAEFSELDIGVGYLDESFDVVICSEVLEHVNDVERALTNLRTMCGKWLILTVPSGRVFPIDRQMGHQKHFAREEIVKYVNGNGFLCSEVWRWGFPFHPLYKWLINLSPEASVRRFAGGEYTRGARLLSNLIRMLFYATFRDSIGSCQLILRAQLDDMKGKEPKT